jgi:hypothetical protein
MRGVASVRTNDDFLDIFEGLDQLLDDIPDHSPHLLQAEASCLHYLRTVRFQRTARRAKYVLKIYESTTSETVKRACIDCWRLWKDRTSFIRERNKWGSLKAEEQRMLWLAAAKFGDDGEKFRLQVRHSLPNAWGLGIERKNEPTFASIYTKWAANGP